MTQTNKDTRPIQLLSYAYFAMALVEIIAEGIKYKPLILFSRIALPILLMTIYRLKSKKPKFLFYLLMVLLLISNVFFANESPTIFHAAILIFILHRITLIVLVFQLIPKKNYLYILLATFPFLVIFFYLISVTNEISDSQFNVLILQSILTSVLSGIALSSYLVSDNRQNSWLLISALILIGLRFIIFIEEYFLYDLSSPIYRPIIVLLYVFASFTFYKFVIAAETNETNPA